MIVFRRLGGELIALNPDLIERVEATPDTVVTLVGEKKFLVEETLEEVLGLVTDWRAFVISRSMDLDIDIESNSNGGQVLHIVPAEHVASSEVVASDEPFDLAPLPDVDSESGLQSNGESTGQSIGESTAEGQS